MSIKLNKDQVAAAIKFSKTGRGCDNVPCNNCPMNTAGNHVIFDKHYCLMTILPVQDPKFSNINGMKKHAVNSEPFIEVLKIMRVEKLKLLIDS